MDIEEIHIETSEWLKTESTKYLRELSLARTPKERDEAVKKLLEIKGRIKSEVREIDKLIN